MVGHQSAHTSHFHTPNSMLTRAGHALLVVLYVERHERRRKHDPLPFTPQALPNPPSMIENSIPRPSASTSGYGGR